jgi:hypothetical protein
MITKIAMVLSVICFSLQAQDTSSYPDTSQYPDTSVNPDTMQNPDSSTIPDSSDYPGASDQDTIDYPDTSTSPDTSQYPDTSVNPDTVPDEGTSSYPETILDEENASYPEPTRYPEDTVYPESQEASEDLENSSETDEVQGDTIIVEDYVGMDGTQSPYSVPSGVVLGVGIGAFFNLSEDNPAYQAFFSRIWGLGDYFAVNLIGEGATDFDNSWYVDGNLRFDLYPLPAYTVISPYLGVGAGIGWGTVTNEDEEALGVNLVGTVGFRLFKDLPVGLTFEANVDWLLNHVVDGNPVVLMGRVGIAF